MCSQRITAAKRMASLRLKVRTWGGEGSAGKLFGSGLSTILDRGGFDLDIPLEFLGERRVGKSHLLANALIGAVLSRGLDENRVFAAVERFAAVVFAVPDDGVLAGRPRRPRNRVDQVRFFEEPTVAIAPVPSLQIREPLKRPGSTEGD